MRRGLALVLALACQPAMAAHPPAYLVDVEPGPPQTGGNVVTLREFLMTEIGQLRHEIDASIARLSERITTNEAGIASNLNYTNHLYDQQAERNVRFDRHLIVGDAAITRLAEDEKVLAELEHRMITIETQGSTNAREALTDIANIREQLTTIESRRDTYSVIWQAFLAVAGLIIGLGGASFFQRKRAR